MLIDYKYLYQLALKPKVIAPDYKKIIKEAVESAQRSFKVEKLELDYDMISKRVQEPEPKRLQVMLEQYPNETLKLVENLQQDIPQTAPASPLDPQPQPPSRFEQWQFLNMFKTVVDADYAIAIIRAATISPQQIEFLLMSQPAFVSALQAAAFEFIVDNKALLTPAQNALLSTLLQVSRVNSDAIQAMQGSYTAEEKSDTQSSDAKPMQTVNSKAIDSTQTPAQKLLNK